MDIFGIVFEMRKERVWMVQTEQQYICIHQVGRQEEERKWKKRRSRRNIGRGRRSSRRRRKKMRTRRKKRIMEGKRGEGN